MRKVKLNLILKESEMKVSILEMNGDRISRSLNYLPANKGFYNVVAKDQKMIRAKNAEEALSAVKEFESKGIEHCYIKIPSGLGEVELSNLRIA